MLARFMAWLGGRNASGPGAGAAPVTLPSAAPLAVPPGAFLLPTDPLAADPALRARSAPLRAVRHARLGAVDDALAALGAEGKLRPDQLDYARDHRARFAEAAGAIALLLDRHPAWPRCRVMEVGSSVTPMLYRRLFPDLRLVSACLFPQPRLVGVVEEAVQVDFEKLDLRTGPALDLSGLDMVMLCEVLEHLLVSPANLFRALAASLVPGGLLYVTTPNFLRHSSRMDLAAGRNPQQIFPASFTPARRFHHHVREYTMVELLAAMAEAGLKVEMAYYSDCWDAADATAALPAAALQNLVVVGRLPA